MSAPATKDGVAEFLSAIPDLSRADLLEHWDKAHGKPAPKGISRRLLEYSAAYQAQVKVFGGLSAATRRKLDNRAQNVSKTPKKAVKPKKAQGLATGARLVREWHGHNHHVEVIEGGFRYEGETYRSLSVIAREITGTRWSGPRFFGL